MGYSQSLEKELEKARYEIAKDEEIVVHGAIIICDKATVGEMKNYLMIEDGHGIMENGNLCAHDGNCIPMKNIKPFDKCTSTEAETALTELIKTASGDSKKRCANALAVLRAGKTSHTMKYPPCALQLLNRWFDADEKEIVEESKGSVLSEEISGLQINLQGILDTAINYYKSERDNELFGETDIPSDECKEEIESLEDIRKNIAENCSDARNAVITNTLFKIDKLDDIATQLKEAKPFVENISSEWEKAKPAFDRIKDLPDYEDIKKNPRYKKIEDYITPKEEIVEIIQNIDSQISALKNWKEDEYHLITKKSFLVCRCGGLITFEDCGQNFKSVADNILASILAMTTQLIADSSDYMAEFPTSDMKNADPKWKSSKAVREGLAKFEEVLSGGDTNKLPSDLCIYLELKSHSYNVELQKALMAMLSLLSVYNGVLAFGLAAYTLVTAEDTSDGALDAGLAVVDMLKDMKGEGIGEFFKSAGGIKLLKVLNVFGIITSIANLFYISNETWIEEITITVFTDTYAHVNKRKLYKNAELIPGEDVTVHLKEEYETNQEGNGLRWKEEPGVYLERVEHLWENRENKGIELEWEDKDEI